MSETPLQPGGYSLAVSSDHDRSNRSACNQGREQKAGFTEAYVILRVRDGREGARKEDRQHHQDGERANIKDAFDTPNGELRGDGKFGAPGDQIGANKLTGAPQKSQTGEADQGRRHHV